MKNTLITIFATLIPLLAFGQYNYGLEVCRQDVRIDGKLNLSDTSNNVIIGMNSGTGLVSQNNVMIGSNAGANTATGHSNVFLGYNTGLGNISGSNNTLLGFRSGSILNSTSNTMLGGWAGTQHSNGGNNVFIGSFAGNNNSEGNSNVFIGTSAGEFCDTCSLNIFIGHMAGSTTDTSNKLFVDNSNTQFPLIYGEFDSNQITINGSFHISEFAEIKPRSSEPFTCDISKEGYIYYNQNTHQLNVCNGTEWMPMNE